MDPKSVNLPYAKCANEVVDDGTEQYRVIDSAYAKMDSQFGFTAGVAIQEKITAADKMEKPGDYYYTKDLPKLVVMNCPFCGNPMGIKFEKVINRIGEPLTLDGDIYCPAEKFHHFTITEGKIEPIYDL